jgi:hypothetical protein
VDSLDYAASPTVPPKKHWGVDVEKVNAYWFYDLARELRAVAALPDDGDANSAMMPIINARWRMINLVTKGDPIPLGVSKASAQGLLTHLENCFSHFMVDDGQGGKKFQWPNDGDKVPGYLYFSFRFDLERFETIFSAEMGDAATYFVPRRGIYNTAALVDAAHETFPPELREIIPEKTKLEWNSAGRCLAFNLCSASGFHVARAVEGAMEIYYEAFVGKTPKELSWGKYLEDLEGVAKRDDLPAEKTLAAIRQMKDDYRNPLMHPRVVLTESEARILFSNGESIIMAMAGELQKLNGQQNLPLPGPIAALYQEAGT